MRQIIILGLLATSALLLGCSSGAGATPVLSGLMDHNPTLQAIGDSVAPASLVSATEGADGETRTKRWNRDGEHRGEAKQRGEGSRGAEGRGMRGGRPGGGHMGDRFGQLLDDPCVQKTGDPKAGGSATFSQCEVRGGTLTGTVTWSPDQDPADDAVSKSTTKQLTFIKTADRAMVPELGPARMWAEAEGMQLLPESWDRAEISSSIQMRGSKDNRDSFQRTGTTTILMYDGTAQVRNIVVTWNAPSNVTLAVDGNSKTIDLSQMRDRMKERMGGRKGERGEWNGEGREKFRQRKAKDAGAVRQDAEAGTVQLTSDER